MFILFSHLTDLEITTPTFSGTINGLSSYMAYPLPIPLEHTVQFSFKISPTTMQQISLLAFIGQNGNHDDKSDHIAVSFIQGIKHFEILSYQFRTMFHTSFVIFFRICDAHLEFGCRTSSYLYTKTS